MCDYSLERFASRPAKVGDRLITTRFGQVATGGFCAVGEPHVAVCVQPGTELSFEREIECEGWLRLFRSRKLGNTVARFRRVNEHEPIVHHDAIELPSGKTVLLTSLCEGQLATVIQLPVTERQSQPKEERKPIVA
jgi:hypothetical protein